MLTFRRATQTLLVLAVLALTAGLLASCTVDPAEEEATFCDILRSEVLAPVDPSSTQPAALARTADTLAELAEKAPPAIDGSVERMAALFDEARRTPRDDLADFVRRHQTEMADLSDEFNAWSVRQCGVVLQQSVPTPTPIADVNVTE